ncbi:LamG domain-containing protein [Haloarchaeobius sp. DT45]|uniref:LamG domain-containing protein n=1 Tax=Haloarchaeobius sp. DT45 TaxID=3446116 RepID=UPI003F6B3638
MLGSVFDDGGDGSGNRGATAPIAQLLMVVLVIVLVGAAVLVASDLTVVQSEPRQVSVTASYDAETGEVRLTHQGGDAIRSGDDGADGIVRVQVRDSSAGGTETYEWTGDIRAGSGFTIDDVAGLPTGDVTRSEAFETGDEVTVVWDRGDSSTVLTQYRIGSRSRAYLAWTLEPLSGLRAYFPLDERDVNAADTVGGASGEIVRADPGVSGQVGTAYAFDGSNQEYVALDRRFDSNGALSQVSACAWFRTGESGTGDFDNWALLDFDRSEYFNLFVTGDGRVGFATTATGGGGLDDQYASAPSGSYNDGSWHLACGVYDGTDKHIYVDGQLRDTKANPHGGNDLGSGATRFGFIGDGSEASSFDGNRNGFYYTGRVDDVRLYTTGLSSGQVADLYDSATGGSATAPTGGLANHWKLDETASPGGDTISDASPTGDGITGENRGAFPGQAGVDGTSFAFRDGQYVALDDSYSASGGISELTACAWFRTSETGTGEFDNWALLDYDRSEYFNLYVRGDTGGVGFSTASPGDRMRDLSTGTNYADGNWHLACGVYTGSEKRIYVDGQLEASATQHGGNPLGTGVTRYGFIGDGSEASSFDGDRNDMYYDGRVDEIRLYERALSPGEIEGLYVADGGGGGNRTVVTEPRSYPRVFANESLRLENVDATLPAGTSVTITVEADPDGDGTFEQSSDEVAISSGTGGVAVTGITADSDTFRLRVDLNTTIPGTTPEFGGAELTDTGGSPRIGPPMEDQSAGWRALAVGSER